MNEKIHAIWLGGIMPPLAQICLDDWKKQGFEFKLWTEKDPIIQSWIEGCRFAKECYRRKLYAFVSDYLRVKILSEFGGLYLDTDVTVNKNPFVLFESCDFSAGYEKDNVLGTAILYSIKGSLIIRELVRFYEDDVFFSDLYMGPSVLNHIINKHGAKNMNGVSLYPTSYFYSYTGKEKYYNKPNDAYLIHWFQYSWKKEKGLIFLKSKNKGFLGKLYIWQKYFLRF